MRLFTKSDLERSARLALMFAAKTLDEEQAISAAVAEVTADQNDWLHVADVAELLEVAYERGQRDYREQRNVAPKEATSDLLP